MSLLTTTIKAFNRDNIKSVKMSGYHLIKDLVSRGATKGDIYTLKRMFNKSDSVKWDNLSLTKIL